MKYNYEYQAEKNWSIHFVLGDGAMVGVAQVATLQKFSKIVLNVRCFSAALLFCLHRCVHLSEITPKNFYD